MDDMPEVNGLAKGPVHCGKNELAGLEQSVVSGVSPPPWNWAFAAIDPMQKSAATRERILRDIGDDSSVNAGLTRFIDEDSKTGASRVANAVKRSHPKHS